MRVRPCARPRHRESSKVRDSHRFGNVDACHSGGGLDENVGILAGFVGGSEETVEPFAEVTVSFFEEGDGEEAVFNTKAHQLCGIAFDRGKLDSVACNPFAVFFMRSNFDIVSISL